MTSSVFTVWNNYDCPNVPSPYFLSSASSEADCKTSCDQNPACSAYVWDDKNKTCDQKSSTCINQGKVTAGKKTVQKLPPTSGYLAMPNANCSTFDLMPAITASSSTPFDQFMKTCAAKCDSNPNCKAIVTDGANCWLKDASCLSPSNLKQDTSLPTSIYTQAYGYIKKKNFACDTVPNLSTVNVVNENECLTRCNNDPSCVAYQISNNNLTCTLKQGVYGSYSCNTTGVARNGVNTATKMPTVTGYSRKDQTYCPNATTIKTYTNLGVQDCAAACTNNLNCKSFVTDGAGNCLLKGAECPYMLTSSPTQSTYVSAGATSSTYIKKPGQICSGNPTVPPIGVTSMTYPMIVNSPDDCKAACSANPDCGAYQTDGGSKCWLRGGQYCANAITTDLNYDTYVKTPTLSNYSSSVNKDCPGVPTLQTMNDVTISACKSACDANPLCRAIVYDGASVCNLKGSDCKLPNTVDKNNMAIYTQTTSGNTFVRKGSWNCPDDAVGNIKTLGSVTDTSPRDCKLLCGKTPNCNAFVTMNDKDCYLKKVAYGTNCLLTGTVAAKTSTFQQLPSDTTYNFSLLANKDCPTASNVTTAVGGSTSKQESPNNCLQQCLTGSIGKPAENMCGAVAWDAQNQTCTFKGMDCPLNMVDVENSPISLYVAPDVRALPEEAKAVAQVSGMTLSAAFGGGFVILSILVACVMWAARKKS